jgi:hypothetical protein
VADYSTAAYTFGLMIVMLLLLPETRGRIVGEIGETSGVAAE